MSRGYNLKEIFKDDPEMLRILEHREMMGTLHNLLASSNREMTVKGASMIKGDKGDKGDTPVKYVDYFTSNELEQVATFLKETVKDEVRPIKGIDYHDGIDGNEGPQGRMGPAGKDGRDGKNGKDAPVINEDGLVMKLLNRIPQQEIPTLEELVKEIKKKKLLEMRDIKNMPLNMNDMRWHGGGLTAVVHDSTLTGQGTTASPLSVVPTTLTGYQQATGTVDGVNLAFSFTTAPNVVVVDGRTMQKVQSDGTVNWTGTTAITLVIAPNFDIYACA